MPIYNEVIGRVTVRHVEAIAAFLEKYFDKVPDKEQIKQDWEAVVDRATLEAFIMGHGEQAATEQAQRRISAASREGE